MTPDLIVRLVEIVAPLLLKFAIFLYERRETLTDEQQAKLDAHKAALDTLQRAKNPPI